MLDSIVPYTVYYFIKGVNACICTPLKIIVVMACHDIGDYNAYLEVLLNREMQISSKFATD